ncbi:MAG: DNA mismatch repair protein MutS [Legionella sp.]|nr:MAG: DNA mismatch repair protein MutS [Legionella sp.]
MTKYPISPEDRALFRDMMRDVTPLDQKTPPAIPLKSKLQHREPIKPKDYDLSDYYADPVQSDSILKYHRHGISPKQTQILKSGQLAWTAKLDLHGLRPDEAKDRLNHFLAYHLNNQHRWVLIIHGKGGRFGEAPVLKNLINHWLRQIPDVLAFHSALPKHGGAGAMYVLLRRVDNEEN